MGRILELARIPVDTQISIIISLQDSPDPTKQAGIDIRRYIKREDYTGWAKAGIRVPLEIFDSLVESMNTAREELRSRGML